MPGPWGKAIERLRLARGWTRARAAARAKMTATTFGRIERGHHISTVKLQAIADAFEVAIDAVLVLPTTEPQSSDVEHLLQRKIREAIREEVTALRMLALSDPPHAAPEPATKERAAIDAAKRAIQAYAGDAPATLARKHATRKRQRKVNG
jgi:transcriptional regulator with XRE-family HTH domain